MNEQDNSFWESKEVIRFRYIVFVPAYAAVYLILAVILHYSTKPFMAADVYEVVHTNIISASPVKGSFALFMEYFILLLAASYVCAKIVPRRRTLAIILLGLIPLGWFTFAIVSFSIGNAVETRWIIYSLAVCLFTHWVAIYCSVKKYGDKEIEKQLHKRT